MKRYVIAGVVIVAALAVGAVTRFTLSALPEPGQAETFLATKAKRFLVHKGSRHGIPPAPQTGRRPSRRGANFSAGSALHVTGRAVMISRMQAGGCIRGLLT
jgi:hypothetical protein